MIQIPNHASRARRRPHHPLNTSLSSHAQQEKMQNNPESRIQEPAQYLHIDSMLLNSIHLPIRRVRPSHPLNLLQLRRRDAEQVIVKEPPQPLGAARRSQRPIVSKVLPEAIGHSVQRREIHRQLNLLVQHLDAGPRGGVLAEELAGLRTALDVEADDGPRGAAACVPHEVDLGAGHVAVDGVFGGGVRVPAA